MGLLTFLINQLWFVVIIAIALVVGIRQFHTKQLIPALIIYVAGILYLTIFNRIGMLIGVNVSFFASLKCLTYTGVIKTIIENVILFVPLGAILYRLKPKWWITFVGVGLTVCIELTQHFVMIGTCEFTDLVANSLGTVIGFAVMKWMMRTRDSNPRG